MSLLNLINRPVMILSRSESGTLDDGGDSVATEVAVETLGELQPRDTSEPPAHPDIADSDWVGFFLIDDAEHLNAASLVWADGLGEFEIEGDPFTWRNPRTLVDGFVVVGLNRVSGTGDSRGS